MPCVYGKLSTVKRGAEGMQNQALQTHCMNSGQLELEIGSWNFITFISIDPWMSALT